LHATLTHEDEQYSEMVPSLLLSNELGDGEVIQRSVEGSCNRQTSTSWYSELINTTPSRKEGKLKAYHGFVVPVVVPSVELSFPFQ
jgi:hypothetical protein